MNSIFEQVGLYVQAWTPEIVPGTSYYPYGAAITGKISDAILSYTHEKLAQGGWSQADISFRATEDQADDWFEYGLNRHIESYGPGHQVLFSGFVNSLEVSRGTLTAIRGPITDIMNRASVTYTPILSTDTVPPIYGMQRPTIIADDADSQAAYGIWEKILQGGRMLPTGAEQYRDSEITRQAWPRTSQRLSLQQSEANTVTLSVLGYFERLRGWIYQDLTAGTRQADVRIADIFANEPSSLFDTSGHELEANATLVSRWIDTGSTAMDAIGEVLKSSDAAGSTWYAGMKGLIPFYRAEPTTPLYQHRIVGPEVTIEEFKTSSNVYPWNVEAGEWLFLTGLLVGKQPQPSILQDPLYQFIQQASYSAPWDLEVNGERVISLGQQIAERGMW